MQHSIHPFRDSNTYSTFQNHIEKVTQEIRSLENEYILKASPTELENHFISKAIIEPLVLHAAQQYIESQTGTPLDISNEFIRAAFPGERRTVRGTQLNIAIPYEGDSGLWKVRPSSAPISGYPEIGIRDNLILLSISFPDDSVDPASLKTDIDRQIQALVNAVQTLHQDVEKHNESVPQIVKSAIQRKRELATSAIGAVAALGIPMKHRDQPLTFTVPTNRRKLPIEKPKVATEAYKPEPMLDEAEYQHILEVTRSMSLVIERNPAAFASLDEEDIRTHFLLQLNGHYEGSASGETFNASGKTDILIRADDRNVFIAECKFWKGQKAFNEAIEQLLSYLSWRDTKCALLIFNKTKDSSAVRQKMHETMTARSEHKRTESYDPNGDAKYILVKASDPGREIIVTIQLYDIGVGVRSEQ